jgi:hypothetical protein
MIMRAKTLMLPNWEQLYLTLPRVIKNMFLKLQKIQEDPKWHPEEKNGGVLEHIRMVYDKALTSNDPDLIMAALFHDLGKAFTAKEKPNGYFSTHGHEQVSAGIVKTPICVDVIKSFGADPETVLWIVENHMRMHRFNEMRPAKRKLLTDHPQFDKLEAFGIIDEMI